MAQHRIALQGVVQSSQQRAWFSMSWVELIASKHRSRTVACLPSLYSLGINKLLAYLSPEEL
jgi:hypothetical protein